MAREKGTGAKKRTRQLTRILRSTEVLYPGTMYLVAKKMETNNVLLPLVLELWEFQIDGARGAIETAYKKCSRLR
jgi:hypothetical protein